MHDTVMTAMTVGDQGTFGMLYALLLGGLIVPLVQWLKRFQWVGGIVDPSFVTALLAISAAMLLANWLAPAMSVSAVIEFALSAIGGATLVYRGGKVYARTKQEGGSE